MRYSLKTKLIGSFAIVLLLMVFAGSVCIYFSKNVQNRHKELAEQNVETMQLIGDVSRMVGYIRSNSELHLLTHSVNDMKRYESEIADWQIETEKNINNLENILKDRATIEKLTEFRSVWETYLRIWNKQVRPLSRAGRDDEAFTLVRKRGTAGRAAIRAMEKLDELHDAIVTAANHSLELAEQDFRKSQMISLTVSLIAIILGLAFTIKQSSNIAGAVNAVSNTAKLVAAGDLEQSVNIRTGDEVESMADSFNIMVSNMKKMVEELQHEITERKKAEKALQEIKDNLEVMVEKRTFELRTANEQLRRENIERKQAEAQTKQLQERLQLQIDRMPIGLIVWDLYFCVQSWNPAAKNIFGFTAEEAFGKHAYDLIVPKEAQPHVDDIWRRLLEGDTTARSVNENMTKDGRTIICDWANTPLKETDGTVVGVLSMIQDITEHKRAEEQIQRQLQRITALRNIDRAISASRDIHLTLNIFLEQVTERLGVDATDVLLLDPFTQTLNYTAGRGFHTDALKHTTIRVGEGYAGISALERRIVSIANLAEAENGLRRSPLLAGEGFIAYYSVPLIAKGHVKGVLEIFYRTPFEANHEWLDFLDALAAQAAIAIDNAGLFNDLERSNVELILAYDTTLEGWSRALDYRDKETEGHSQRVADATLKIARTMGLSDKELVHMRRGALLHDIGKLGVPDAVLFKNGKLDDEEWEIMCNHPVLAYELLSPIAFLRPALDIPYCHHEKWDGTGYPRGLKGEQIPLSARIFAVVDVWDALISDRTYRPAWSEERVTEHIREQAGKHFDPKVVEIFLKFLSEQKS